MQARAAADPEIEVHLGARVERINGDDSVTGITLADVRDGSQRDLEVAGVFAAGDVVDAHHRQAVTAAASGTVAALDAEECLAWLADATAGLVQAAGAPVRV